MLRRRLSLQIYLTIVGSLILVVILSGLLWKLLAQDRQERDLSQLIATLAFLSLPAVEAPYETQEAAVARIAKAVRVDLTLFDANRQLVAASGAVASPPERHGPRSGWQRGGPREWVLMLPDGRWLVADLRRRPARRPLLGLIAFLTVAALGVAIGAYPLVRRLTRRLERLQVGVERIGAGDLSARVDVRGRDEVAALAASFNEAAGKIEKLVGAHRMLLAHASHELRTPLSRIRMGIELLGGSDDTRREALQRDIAELDELIDEILLMSRLDAGAESSERRPVDLLAVVAEESARYRDVSVEGSAPEILGDAVLLRRLVRNLLENAHVHGAPPVSAALSVESGAVVLRVSDRGPGIPAEDRQRVLEPFYRGSDRQNVDGYGLGLALVLQIARSHGGSVKIDDAVTGGTVVEVAVPVGAALAKDGDSGFRLD